MKTTAPLITASAAAVDLGISDSHCRRLCRQHKIGTCPNTRQRFLSVADLRRLKRILDRLATSKMGRSRISERSALQS